MPKKEIQPIQYHIVDDIINKDDIEMLLTIKDTADENNKKDKKYNKIFDKCLRKASKELEMTFKRDWDWIRLEKFNNIEDEEAEGYGDQHFVAFLFLNDDFEDGKLRIFLDPKLTEDDFEDNEDLVNTTKYKDIKIKKGRMLILDPRAIFQNLAIKNGTLHQVVSGVKGPMWWKNQDKQYLTDYESDDE